MRLCVHTLHCRGSRFSRFPQPCSSRGATSIGVSCLHVGLRPRCVPRWGRSQVPAAVLHVHFYLDGVRDVFIALFQLWLSSHAPAMALRVNLILRSQCLTWCVYAQAPPLVPHVILRLTLLSLVLDRLEVLLTSSFSHWGSTLSLLRAQAPSLVLRINLRLSLQWPALDRLEALLPSSFSHWGPVQGQGASRQAGQT